MKENYWIRREMLEAESFRLRQEHQAAALKDKQNTYHQDQQLIAEANNQQQLQQRHLHKLPIDQARTQQTTPSHNNNNNHNNEHNNNNTDHHHRHDTNANHNSDNNYNSNINDNNNNNNNNNDNINDNNSIREEQQFRNSTGENNKPNAGAAVVGIDLRDPNMLKRKECKRSSSSVESRDKQQVKKRQQQTKKDENDVNLSFCGCGFLGIYHVGVASCFHEYAPQLSMHKISGSSAGALVAMAHICGNLQLAYATTDILRVAIDARARALGPFHPSFDINATIREALERALPEDIHLKASGKLHISLTRVYDGENVIVSEFDSKEEVIQVLLCTCFIPFWSGLIAPKYKGVTYIDGGFSNNLLTLNDKTVTVSPFAGEADICPQDDTFNLLQVYLSNTSFSLSPSNLYRLSHALLPPAPEVLSDLCEQGFADGIRFLQRMKLISCTKCIEIRSSLLVTTNGEDMEEAFTNSQVRSIEPGSTSGPNSGSENHHIRLEQQEQKMIEINGNQRRNSIVSKHSQVFQHQSALPLSKSSSYHTLLGDAISAIGANDDEDDDHIDGDIDDNCDECVLMRQKAATCGPLPKLFSDRIRDSCDTVNKSLSNWIYSHRPIKYLSYLAAPYYLPIDISVALVRRYWRRIPIIRSDILKWTYNVVELLVDIIVRMHSRSTTSKLLMGSAARWEENAIEYEKGIVSHHQKTKPTIRRRRSSCSNGSLAAMVEPSSLPVGGANGSGNGTVVTDGNFCVSKFLNKSRNSSTNQLHSLEDTFDSIVDVTSNQEARIFAYYFRDAKNRLQVTEIFDLERAAELSQSAASVSTNN